MSKPTLSKYSFFSPHLAGGLNLSHSSAATQVSPSPLSTEPGLQKHLEEGEFVTLTRGREWGRERERERNQKKREKVEIFALHTQVGR